MLLNFFPISIYQHFIMKSNARIIVIFVCCFANTGQYLQRHITRQITSIYLKEWSAMEFQLWQFQEAKWFMKVEFSMSQQEKANMSLVHHSLHMSTNESDSGNRLIKLINLWNALYNMRITSSWEKKFWDSMVIFFSNQNMPRWEERKRRTQILLLFILQKNIVD